MGDLRKPLYRIMRYFAGLTAILIGVIIFFTSNNDNLTRSSSMVVVVFGVFVLKRDTRNSCTDHVASVKIEKKRITPYMWVSGAASIALTSAAFAALYRDAERGYQQVLPVYLFAASVIICAVVWSYLASRTF